MSKQEYYTKILNKHKNNINETFNILRNVTGSSTANTFLNSFFINNKLISNKNDIVNDFNNLFTNIGPDLARNISNTSNKHFIDYLGSSVTESIFLSPVSYSELLNVVSKLKCKKSFDYHCLNMWIIKKIIISVLEPFMHICNLSFSKGISPLQMKIAKLFLYLNQVISLNLTTIVQYQCFLSFQKFWKIYLFNLFIYLFIIIYFI